MPLVSNPLSLPPLLYRADSKLRLLLSVWRAGCENVAATSACVCVSLNACAPPPPLSSERDRGQVPWIARSLLPPPLSLSLSVLPSPSLPSPLSADINTQGTAAKIPGKVVKILGGYWIEREGEKTADRFVCWVHMTQTATFCGHSLVVQALLYLRNIKGKKLRHNAES